MLLLVSTMIILAIGGFGLYLRLTRGICRCTQRLDGQTVIVTGANTGIGKETARSLAQKGARVILACRDMKRAEEAQKDIIATTGNKNVVIQLLDLSSLKSVREFAKKIHETELRLDVLVNNAGLLGSTKITADGLELTMQVNHFGPLLLTILLLDILKKSAPSRIIMVSSDAHNRGKLDLKDLNSTKKKNSFFQLYSNSKLCNVLIANELARKLAGTGVTVNSLHPGVVMTDVFRRIPNWGKKLVHIFGPIMFKDCVQGAQTTIHLAISEKLATVTGQYFSDCKVDKQSPSAQDEELAKGLWKASLECLQLEEKELCVN